MELRKILDSDLTGKGVVGQSDTPGLSALDMQKKVEEIAREVIIPIFNQNVQTLEENAGTTDGTLSQKADKTYVDAQDTAIKQAMQQQKTELQQEIASGDSTTLQSAKEYTDTRETSIKQYVDAQDSETLTSAKDYTDLQDATNLQSAKSYTDTRELAIKQYVSQQDAATLEIAKTYADTQDESTLENAKAYVDGKLDQKANANDVYTKAQADQKLDAKANVSDVLLKGNTTPFTPTNDYDPATKAYADSIAAQAGAVTSVFGRAGAVVAQTGDYTADMVGARSDTWLPTPQQIGAASTSDVQQVQSNLATHVANGTIHVTAQEKETWNASGGVVYEITLLSSSWTQSGEIFVQTITIPNSNSNTKVDLYTDVQTEAKIASPIRAVNENGTITAQTLVAPSEDLTVQAVASEVKEGA